MWRIGRLLERVEEAMLLVGAELTVALELLELVRGVAADVPDLDPGFFHALVDDADDVVSALLGQDRDVEPDDRAVDIRGQADVALDDRPFDRPKDAAMPTAGSRSGAPPGC